MSTWAFLGAGEFEDWHDDLDRTLLDGRDGRVLVLATASAPEGNEVFDRWVAQGLAHYARLGVEAAAPPLKRREDAEDPAIVDQLRDAALVFFSGGNPAYLSRVLAGTAFWGELRAAIAEDALVYAGCSAGVAVLSDPTFDSDQEDFTRVWAPGLGHFRDVLFAPHWDIVDTWIPGARDFITRSAPADGLLIGLDERTAMVGDGDAWRVEGRAGVHLYREGVWTDHAAGASFALPLPVASG